MRKIIFALAVAGIIDSALALQAHFGAGDSVVSHGPYSTIGPIPVAVIGVVGYVLLALLGWFHRRGWTLLFAWIGLGFAAYLSYVEAFVLHAWSVYWAISQCLIAVIAVLALVDAGIAIAQKLKGASEVVEQAVNNLRYG